jgi:hypothetical protein
MIRLVGLEIQLLLALILLPYGSFVTTRILTRTFIKTDKFKIDSFLVWLTIFGLVFTTYVLIWRAFPYEAAEPFLLYCILLSGISTHLTLQKLKWQWWITFNNRLGKLKNITTFIIGLLLSGGLLLTIIIGLLRTID